MKPTSARLVHANFASSGQPDQLSEATSNLFVYGTLVVDEVVRSLIDRVPAHEPVTAQGWRVARLTDRLYPGLVPDDGYAHGRLYTDLTTREWATLDAFEDPAYTLININVLPGSRNALAYVWRDEHLPNAWTVDGLSSTDLENYIERCGAWRRRYEKNGSPALDVGQ